MADYATWTDVVTSFEQPMADSQKPRIEALIRQASARLTAMVPSLPARLASGEVDPEVPSSLVVEAVLRLYRNPVGAQQQSVGPFNLSFAGGQKTGIYFDPEVVNALLAPISALSPGVGSFRVGIPRHQRPARGLDADW